MHENWSDFLPERFYNLAHRSFQNRFCLTIFQYYLGHVAGRVQDCTTSCLYFSSSMADMGAEMGTGKGGLNAETIMGPPPPAVAAAAAARIMSIWLPPLMEEVTRLGRLGVTLLRGGIVTENEGRRVAGGGGDAVIRVCWCWGVPAVGLSCCCLCCSFSVLTDFPMRLSMEKPVLWGCVEGGATTTVAWGEGKPSALLAGEILSLGDVDLTSLELPPPTPPPRSDIGDKESWEIRFLPFVSRATAARALKLVDMEFGWFTCTSPWGGGTPSPWIELAAGPVPTMLMGRKGCRTMTSPGGNRGTGGGRGDMYWYGCIPGGGAPCPVKNAAGIGCP